MSLSYPKHTSSDFSLQRFYKIKTQVFIMAKETLHLAPDCIRPHFWSLLTSFWPRLHSQCSYKSYPPSYLRAFPLCVPRQLHGSPHTSSILNIFRRNLPIMLYLLSPTLFLKCFSVLTSYYVFICQCINYLPPLEHVIHERRNLI